MPTTLLQEWAINKGKCHERDRVLVPHALCNMDMLDDYEFECQYGDLCIEDLGCYDNEDEGEPFPLDYANIQEYQSKDAVLQRQLTTSNKFAKKNFTVQNKVFELIT